MDGPNRVALDALHLSVPLEEVREAIRRLLDDMAFKATERNRRFLVFIADETLAGRGDAIKAYSVAVDVFNRPDTFDPSADPIVRIEATRLRANLAEYYQGAGAQERIRIDLPKGRYIPTFSRVSSADGLGCPVENEPILQEEVDEPLTHAVSVARPRWTTRSGAGCAVLTAAVLAVGYVFWAGSTPKPFSNRPAVSLAFEGNDASSEAETSVIKNRLLTVLSRFRTLRIVPDSSPTDASNPKSIGGVAPMQYRVEVKLMGKAPGRGVWWQLVETTTRETKRSGFEPLRGLTGSYGDDELLGTVANDIAGAGGAVVVEELAREMDAPTLGNGCVLRAGVAIRSQGTVSLQQARTCLEATLDALPNDADATAMLALVLVQIDPVEKPTRLVPEALLLARRASLLDPLSARAAFALMMARYRNGQLEAAVSAGREAMALNPYNGLVAAKFGGLLLILGREAEGMALIGKAEQIAGGAMPEVLYAKALTNYRHGRFDNALSNLKAMDDPRVFGPGFLQLAVLGQLGRSADIETFVKDAGLDRTRLERAFYPLMTGRHMAAPLVELMRVGLIKAGLDIPAMH